jgi:hypothetical protein
VLVSACVSVLIKSVLCERSRYPFPPFMVQR